MSVFHTRPALRWLVPTGAALAIIGGGAAVGTFASAAEPSLPERSAAQLLVDLQTARLDGLSGTVLKRADLGLPSLPGIGGRGSAELPSLISGTHTLRVWHAGPEQTRVALLGTLGETDVIRNGADVWIWDSQANEARHSTLDTSKHDPAGRPDHLPSTPQEAAEQALAAIDPSTTVSVGRSTSVAGRDAYNLVLEPRDATSLVGQITIAIDAAEHVPLRFQVVPQGTKTPAFEVAFTQVDFERPDPAQFTFNPPPGTKVIEESVHPERPDVAEEAKQAERPTLVGDGWTTVVVARVPQLADVTNPDTGAGEAGEPNGDLLRGVLDGLPRVSGDWGSGRLFTSKLLTGLATDDGRVLIGAVTPERLYEVAQSTK